MQNYAAARSEDNLFGNNTEYAIKASETDSLKNLVKAKDPSKTIRSSAGHFWRVTRQMIKGDIESGLSPSQKKLLEKLMAVEGWVIGDLHNGNVSPIRVGVTKKNPLGEIDYGVVDYDDPAPKGSLIFDLVHHIIAAKAVETPSYSRLTKQEIFDNYLEGLKNGLKKGSFSPPARIAKLLQISPEEFRQMEIKKATKFTLPDGRSLIKDGVKSSDVTSAEVQEVQSTIDGLLSGAYEVLDVGGREKDSGGSAGALRYLLLLKEIKTGDQFLFELKEEPISAVGEYKKQPNYSHEDVLDHYVNKNKADKDIRFRANIKIDHEGKKVEMTLRPKPLYFFDYANDGNHGSAFKEFRDLTLFNAFWLGFKQLRDDQSNASELLKLIKDEGTDKVFEAIKEISRELNQFYAEQAHDFKEALDLKKKEKK